MTDLDYLNTEKKKKKKRNQKSSKMDRNFMTMVNEKFLVSCCINDKFVKSHANSLKAMHLKCQNLKTRGPYGSPQCIGCAE